MFHHRRAHRRPPSTAGPQGPNRGERGAAIVEFALVIPVLAMLLMGTVSAGSLYNRRLSLSHAVREGARYAAVLAPDQTFASGTWATNARDVVIARSAGELSGTGATVCVALVSGSTAAVYSTGHATTWFSTKSDGTACDTTDTYSTTTNDNGLRVQVVVTRTGRLDAGIASRNVTLRSFAIVQSEYAS